MVRKLTHWSVLLLTAFLLMASAPAQESTLTIPWWGWMLAITIVLLGTFLFILAFDWRDSDGQHDDE